LRVTSPRAWIALAALGLIVLTALAWAVFGRVADTVDARGVLLRRGGVRTVKATIAGKINHFLANAGQSVKKGDPLVEISAGEKQSIKILCPEDGLTLRRVAHTGETVKAGDDLLLYEPTSEPLQAVIYLPTSLGYRIESGQVVQVLPANAKPIESGFVRGSVVSASRFPVTLPEMTRRLQNETLARELFDAGLNLQVLVRLEADANSRSGCRWSSPLGNDIPLFSGTPCQARFVVQEFAPIQLVFPAQESFSGGP
jgi:multidrug efflux pump subunit AcrA (membrane-fusion protein)